MFKLFVWIKLTSPLFFVVLLTPIVLSNACIRYLREFFMLKDVNWSEFHKSLYEVLAHLVTCNTTE